jgi:exosome complex RNA-binding protein Csl4
MSIVAGELIAYSVASIPTDDVSTSGGAIDATRRPVFTQLTSNAVIALISDGTDVRVVTLTGRDATGAVVTENVTLTNGTEVLGLLTFERLQSVNVASSSGTRTITVKQGSGGSTITTIPINEVGFHMMFQNAASAAGTQVRHEKMFWKNTNATLTLTTSTMTLTVDASTKINLGVETSTGGTTSVANRLAVPSNPTFVGVGTAQAIPSGGNLAAAATIGVWIRQSLASNDAAQKNSFTTQLAGNTV